MPIQPPYHAYASASVATSQFSQLITLYDGVINFLSQARLAMEEGNHEKKANLLTRASGIIHGLQECLDTSQGDETLEALNHAYEGIDSLILSALAHDNAQLCEKAAAHLRQLREVWKEVEAIAHQGSALGMEAGIAEGGSAAIDGIEA